MNRTAALLASLMLAVPSPCLAAPARELTPDVRARLFQPTAQVDFTGDSLVVPMRGTDRNGYYECPYFQVYVDGKGPFTFLFDTGASYTVVGDRVVEAVHPFVVFDRGGRRDVVRLGSIGLGGAVLRDVWAIHDDSFGVDGILGFPVLGLNAFMFDLAARELTVSRKAIVLPRAAELAYEMPLNVPTVPMRIGGRDVQILIDTGDDAYGLELRGAELGDARIAHSPDPPVTLLNGELEQSARVTTLIDDVELGPFRARSVVIAVNDDLPVGDLGYDVLKQFRIAFEPRGKVVYFQPLFEESEFAVPPERSAGFTMHFDGSGKVRRVVAGSLAESAGIAADDTIISIEGMPGPAYTRQAWDALIEHLPSIEVRWSHDAEERAAAIGIVEIR